MYDIIWQITIDKLRSNFIYGDKIHENHLPIPIAF